MKSSAPTGYPAPPLAKSSGMKKYILKSKWLLFASLFFGTAFAAGSTLIALILKEIVDIAIAQDLQRFFTLSLQTAVYLAVVGICFWLFSKLSKKFICQVTKHLREDAFSGIFKKNISDFRAVNSADYLSALTNDVRNIEENFLDPLLLCALQAAAFVSSFAIMVYFSPLVTVCLFVTMFLVIIIPSLFNRKIQERQDGFSASQSKLSVAIKDFLSGFEVIRAYHMNGYAIDAFGDSSGNVYDAKYSLDRLMAAVEAVSTMLGVAVQCIIMFLSAYLIIIGKISAGTLLGIVQVSGSIVSPIQAISQNLPRIKGCAPIIARLTKLRDYEESTFTGTDMPTFDSSITIKDLSFAYGDGNLAVNGINFSFEKGKKYAVVGKSGCGKTTLVNLLTGYYASFTGEILYDGKDLRQLDIEKLNGLSSVIHQNVYMFDESIGNNICLHQSIDDDTLKSALEISGVEMFLVEDKTLDTPVGENGNNLSGGQRQRVAVARALAQQKNLLILDEGTSAVDMQTAYDIERELLKIESLTLITITHSLNPALLANYDEILFMEQGELVETSSFENLLSEKGRFCDFYDLKE